jgi:O-succinylhomoserine sulfhydrylase
MNEQEFLWFETQAIRNQLERTQYLEHSCRCISRLVLYLKMPKMRASFAEEKTGFTAVTATQITTNLLAKYALWKAAAGFAFASGMAAVYSTMAALLNSGDHIVSSSSVFVQRIRCLLIIFQNGTYKPRILTSINLRLLKV